MNSKAPKQETFTKPNTPLKDSIIVIKVLPKNKGFVLKIHPSNVEITRQLKDIYWLQNQMSFEFPFYYVGL